MILLEISRKLIIKKFLKISTAEVYGSINYGELASETMLLNLNNLYAASKASVDLIVRSYNKTYGIHTNITRYANNYGTNQYPEKLIPLVINNLINKQQPPIYGDGENIRDWIYVYDNCSAIDAFFYKGKNEQIYNISGESEKTNN